MRSSNIRTLQDINNREIQHRNDALQESINQNNQRFAEELAAVTNDNRTIMDVMNPNVTLPQNIPAPVAVPDPTIIVPLPAAVPTAPIQFVEIINNNPAIDNIQPATILQEYVARNQDFNRHLPGNNPLNNNQPNLDGIQNNLQNIAENVNQIGVDVNVIGDRMANRATVFQHLGNAFHEVAQQSQTMLVQVTNYLAAHPIATGVLAGLITPLGAYAIWRLGPGGILVRVLRRIMSPESFASAIAYRQHQQLGGNDNNNINNNVNNNNNNINNNQNDNIVDRTLNQIGFPTVGQLLNTATIIELFRSMRRRR